MEFAIVAVVRGKRGDKVLKRERSIGQLKVVAEHAVAHAIYAYRPHDRSGEFVITQGHADMVHSSHSFGC